MKKTKKQESPQVTVGVLGALYKARESLLEDVAKGKEKLVLAKQNGNKQAMADAKKEITYAKSTLSEAKRQIKKAEKLRKK